MKKLIRKAIPKDLATMPGIREITQIAVITRDTEKTVQQLAKALNPGAFKIVSAKPPQLFNRTYNDSEEPWTMKAGLTWIGNTQLEVIQPTSGHTVFDDYLANRNNKPGIEHIYLVAQNYNKTCEKYAAAGFPLKQTAQLNASGKLGIISVPALPKAFENLAARFGYTSTQAKLKLDIELAKFPPGVSQRVALRAAIPEQWIPSGRPYHFESVPADAPLADIDAFYVLGSDLDSLIDAYSGLTDRIPVIDRYRDDHLPGKGRLARIAIGTSLLVLVEPESGPVHTLFANQGEGITLVRGRPKQDVKTSISTLESLGWTCISSPLPTREIRAMATHHNVPFALWISSE
jgi:hypothetical protein